MDKPGRGWRVSTERRMPRSSASTPLELPPPEVRERLLAKQIAGSRYLLHDLAPARNCTWTLALAGREECAPDYCVDRATYPFHVVELVATGRGSIRFDGGPEQPIGPGAVFAYQPRTRCVLRTDPTAPLVKFFFALAGREVPRRLSAAGLGAGMVRRLRRLVCAAWKKWRTPSDWMVPASAGSSGAFRARARTNSCCGER